MYLCSPLLLLHSEPAPDSIRLRPHLDYRPQEDILLLRAQTEAPRHGMLPGRHRARLHQVAICRYDSGDLWLPQPLWVRLLLERLESVVSKHLVACSDFFPVIVTFLRQLPFIGTLLSLPYIRNVSVGPQLHRYPHLPANYPRSWIVSRVREHRRYEIFRLAKIHDIYTDAALLDTT